MAGSQENSTHTLFILRGTATVSPECFSFEISVRICESTQSQNVHYPALLTWKMHLKEKKHSRRVHKARVKINDINHQWKLSVAMNIDSVP